MAAPSSTRDAHLLLPPPTGALGQRSSGVVRGLRAHVIIDDLYQVFGHIYPPNPQLAR